MYTTILLAYDGSEHAQNALKHAVSLAKACDAKLYLAHTPQMDTPPIVVGGFVAALDLPPTKEQIEEAGSLIIKQAQNEAKALGATFADSQIGRGEPVGHTLDMADRINADLIVMGRRGLGVIRTVAFGSVSHGITHGAKCACLTVL